MPRTNAVRRACHCWLSRIRDYLKLRRDDALPPKPAGYDSLYLLADDFDDFLSRCHPWTDDGD